MRLQLLGLARGHVIGVDVTSQRRALAPLRVLDDGAPVEFVRAASFYAVETAGNATGTVPRAAAVLLAGGAAQLQFYLLQESDGTVEASQCGGGVHTVDVAAAGYRLRQVELLATAAGERTTVAAALLQSATDSAHHEIALYQLSIGDSDATMPRNVTVARKSRRVSPAAAAAYRQAWAWA